MINYKNIPALRFKEFEGEWEKATIDKILSIGSGKDYKHLESGDIPVYGSGGYMLSVNKYLYEGESVCIGRKGTIDKPIFLNEKFWTVDTLFYTHSFVGSIPYFVYLLFNRINWYKYNEASGVPSLSKKTISKIKINLPTKPEQQKIANFLTTIDTKIQQLRQKQQLLENYKKGVMQQIFKQEIRFKKDDGGAFEDWEVKRLGEVGTYYNGLTGKTKENFGSGKPFIKYKQIFDNSQIDLTKCDFVEIFENEKQQKAQYGDIFFTTSSETPLQIGFSSVLLDEVEELYLNSFSFGFRPESLKVLVPKFAQFLFRSNFFRKEIIKLAQGSTRYNMSKVQLMKNKISLPCEAEQQEIANFLSSIDKSIASVKEQIGGMEDYKKGLLQGMFV
jgi:type I restriction enzyme S subunit